MARIELPPGDGGELERVWSLSPELGAAVGELAGRVGGKGLSLSWRVREAARMRIAHVNGCTICMGWRVPALARHGVDEELYAHVEDWESAATTRRRSGWRSSTPRSSRSTTVRSTMRSSPA